MRLVVTPFLYTPSRFTPSKKAWSLTALKCSCVITNIYTALQIRKCPNIHIGNRHVCWQATFGSATVG